METMQSAVLAAHTFIAIMITVLVLMQRGKGAEAGAAFGAGASGTVFGSRGTTSFFSRATAVLAAGFFISSLTLAYLSSQRGTVPDSLLEGAAPIEVEQGLSDPDAAEPAAGLLPELPELDAGQPAGAAGDLPALQEAPATQAPAAEAAEEQPQ